MSKALLGFKCLCLRPCFPSPFRETSQLRCATWGSSCYNMPFYHSPSNRYPKEECMIRGKDNTEKYGDQSASTSSLSFSLSFPLSFSSRSTFFQRSILALLCPRQLNNQISCHDVS
ncbi:hypothetical protein LZ32DRAFT_312045 [Colletotrichum eremochloae]|nr:hypothetical protein LZ32DRAFT_312045 [Colletotrichum eremochloae]